MRFISKIKGSLTTYYITMKTRSQKIRQQQAIDQNFANGTLYMTMSTLESLFLKTQDNGHKCNKFFGAYDQYDYSQKSKDQLMLQAINQIMLLSASRLEMIRSHSAYQLPSNCNIDMVLKTLYQYHNVFQKYAIRDCQQLTTDVINILQGNNCDMNYPKILNEIRPKFSGSKTNHNAFGQNMINEAERIHKEEQILSQNENLSVSQLKFKQNTKMQDEKQEQSRIKLQKYINHFQKQLKNINKPDLKVQQKLNIMKGQVTKQITKIYEQKLDFYKNIPKEHGEKIYKQYLYEYSKWDKQLQHIDNAIKSRYTSNVSNQFSHLIKRIQEFIKCLKYELQHLKLLR